MKWAERNSLDRETPSPVETDTAEIDVRSRIRLPQELFGRAGWGSEENETAMALVVMREPGTLILLPWEEAGPPVVARRKELIEKLRTNPSVQEALLALEQQYKSLPIPEDLRPTLSGEMRAHLGVQLGKPTTIFVARLNSRILLEAPEARRVRMNMNFREIEDLPS